MIQATEIAFIGHPVSDVPRAREFYEKILGLVPSMAHEFQAGQWWIEYEVGGVAVALSNAWPPGNPDRSRSGCCRRAKQTEGSDWFSSSEGSGGKLSFQAVFGYQGDVSPNSAGVNHSTNLWGF